MLTSPSSTNTSTSDATVDFTGLGALAREARVPLLAVDPDFAAAVPVAERTLAEAALHVTGVDLDTGRWLGPGTHTLVVLDGVLSRTVTLHDRSSLELLGAGDLIARESTVPPDGETVRWDVHEPATLAILDQRFERATQRWPGLWQVVLERTASRNHRLASHVAALQLSRVEDRIEAVLWQLADRFGRVTPAGVVLPLRLTHAMVGRLAAAKRPTVSLAFTVLADQGRVVPRPGGGWVLHRAEGG